MNTIIINEIIIPIIGAGVATILEIGRRQVKAFLDSKQDLINKQKEALKQTMGIELYNKDVAIVKSAVKAVEQIAKENDWKGAIKHSKVLELIQGKTELIKGAVLEVNSIKSTTVQK